MQVASPLLEQSGLQTNTYYFIQDDWRVHPRLTLNLGLRYELPKPWVHPPLDRDTKVIYVATVDTRGQVYKHS